MKKLLFLFIAILAIISCKPTIEYRDRIVEKEVEVEKIVPVYIEKEVEKEVIKYKDYPFPIYKAHEHNITFTFESEVDLYRKEAIMIKINHEIFVIIKNDEQFIKRDKFNSKSDKVLFDKEKLNLASLGIEYIDGQTTYNINSVKEWIKNGCLLPDGFTLVYTTYDSEFDYTRVIVNGRYSKMTFNNFLDIYPNQVVVINSDIGDIRAPLSNKGDRWISPYLPYMLYEYEYYRDKDGINYIFKGEKIILHSIIFITID